jgi:hypothetical protein
MVEPIGYQREEQDAPGSGSVAMSRESSARTMMHSIMAGEVEL